jgi:hypothetical protein
MPCRYPANRGRPGLVTAIGRVGGRFLETDAALEASEGTEMIQGGA